MICVRGGTPKGGHILKYSIIIPTYNRFDLLEPCLASIIKNTNLEEVEIIIVSNGCQDRTPTYLKTLGNPFKPIIITDPLGYPKAVNLGLAASTGEFIVLLNNDTILLDRPQKNMWLDILREPFDLDILTGVTGPLPQYNEEAGYPFIVFFCAMISRKLLNIIGPLDELFSPGSSEDIDFCIRAQLQGFRVTQVPINEKIENDGTRMTGSFPIYHAGEETVHKLQNWNEIFKRNKQILKNKYGGK